MLISAKTLQDLPVITKDNEHYLYVDSVMDSTGLFMKALIVREEDFGDAADYVIPAIAVSAVFPEEGIFLTKDSNEMSQYLVAAAFNDIVPIRTVDFEMDGEDTYIPSDLDQFLLESGYSCNFLMDQMRFKTQCTDDKLGKTKDILLHPTRLNVHYLVVEVGHTFSKRWAYVPAQALQRIDWEQRVTYLNETKADVTSGPLLNPKTEVNSDLEDLLDMEVPQTLWSNLYDPQKRKEDWSHMDY